MGERTQLILKTKDRFGDVNVKVYHEQWGFGKTMPMIILEFICSLQYGATGQREFLDVSYNQNGIYYMSDFEKLSDDLAETARENLKKYSIHNLKLNSMDITENYKDMYIVNGNYSRTLEVDGVKGCSATEWDFDIYNVNSVRMYTGDNNQGLALVSVEEKVIEKYRFKEVEHDVTVGFLLPEHMATEKGGYIKVNTFQDIYGYCKEFSEYCPKQLIKSIETIYDYFGVTQLGKKVKEKVKS